MGEEDKWASGEDDVVHTLRVVESFSLAFVILPPHTL